MSAVRRARERVHLLLERWNFSRRIEITYLLRQMRTRLGPHPSASGVDIACGLGSQTVEISNRRLVRLIGLDLNPGVIRLARGQRGEGRVAFLVGDAGSLPFTRASFDFATSVCAFEHFPDDRHAFEEAARVVRPGGWFFLTVDSLTHPAVTEEHRARHRAACAVRRYYTADGLRASLEAAGFEVADTQYLLRGRLASRLSRFGLANGFSKSYLLASVLLYPLVWIEERLTRGEHGYKLGAVARRPPSAYQE